MKQIVVLIVLFAVAFIVLNTTEILVAQGANDTWRAAANFYDNQQRLRQSVERADERRAKLAANQT